MRYKKIGRNGIEISAIGLGTWEFGQTKAWGIGKIENYKKIVDYALDHGINFIDTAEGYGKSEEILGGILEGRRDEVILATKMSRGYDWSYMNMLERIKGSLKRLKTDYVDLYQIHWPKIKGRFGCPSDMEAKDYENIQDSMEKLQKEGLIKFGGVSNFRLHHLKNFSDRAFNVIVTNQVPYNLLWRGYDRPDISEFCRQKKLKYIAYSSLAQGLLTGKYSKDSQLTEIQKANILFNEPVYSRAMKVVEVVKTVAEEIDATPAQVALKWLIEKELTASVLVGIRRIEELEENIEATDLNLSRDQMDRLEKASLEFWEPMPPRLELWLHDNSKQTLEKIGVNSSSGYS